jgi:hypothetical protein
VTKALVFCVFAVALPLNAGERLAMRITPVMAFEPAILTVRTVIEADIENRTLEIVAQSADYYRRSSIQLDGANAPRLNVFEFRNLPTGIYDVMSILVGSDGEQATVSRRFHVAAAAGSGR